MLRLVRFFRRCDSCNSYNSVLLRTNDTVQRLCIRTVTNSCKQSINFNKVTDKIATNYSNGFNSDDSDSSSDSHSNSRNYWKKVVGCATIVMLSPLLLSAYYSSYDNNNDNISDNYNNSSFSHCDANSSSGDDPNYDKTAIDDIAKKRYSAIIVGGGTGGCITAYLTAKWLHHNRIPGQYIISHQDQYVFGDLLWCIPLQLIIFDCYFFLFDRPCVAH